MCLTIYNHHGRAVSTVTDIKCIPSQRRINELSEDGYTFAVDGETYSKSQVRKVCLSRGDDASFLDDVALAPTSVSTSVESESESHERQLICSILGV